MVADLLNVNAGGGRESLAPVVADMDMAAAFNSILAEA
jgi:hypothetical protein